MRQEGEAKNKFRNTLKIAVHDKDGIRIIDFDKIIYCKAEGNYTIIYFADRNILLTKVLKQVESFLPDNVFLRIHKSYLININAVTEFKQNTIILGPDIKLPISRRRKAKVLKKIKEKLLFI